MAKGKYKNKHKHANRDNNIFRFIFDEKTNDQIINEIRKFDKNEEVENGYKKLVSGINNNGMYFFNNYENTIPNHIVGRIFVSNLAYKLDEFKKQKLINKGEFLFELGFNGKKVMSALKRKALLINKAETIEEVLDTANQILKLAEILNNNHGV